MERQEPKPEGEKIEEVVEETPPQEEKPVEGSMESKKGASSDSPTSSNEQEETAEDIEIDLVKASDLVRDYFIKRYPWIFLFQIDSVDRNSADNVYIVKCSFFPIQGGYEKNYYTIKVNIKTGKFMQIKGFSLNTQTGVKKHLAEEPPVE